MNILVSDAASPLEKEVVSSSLPSESSLAPDHQAENDAPRDMKPVQTIDVLTEESPHYETHGEASKQSPISAFKDYFMRKMNRLYAGLDDKKRDNPRPENKKYTGLESPLPLLKEHVSRKEPHETPSLISKLGISISGRPVINSVGQERDYLLTFRKWAWRIASGRSRYSSSPEGSYARTNFQNYSSKSNYAFQG